MSQDEENLKDWVQNGSGDNRKWRQAVHVFLQAIAYTDRLNARIALKGGILLALQYDSSRYTKDVDLTSLDPLEEDLERYLQDDFNTLLQRASAMLGYPLVCKVQRCKRNPKNPDFSFPSLKLSVGYATIGSAEAKRLERKQCPSSFEIDLSFNEVVQNTHSITLASNQTLLCYDYADLVAEKFRAILQQIDRNRYRRQDIYDLNLLLQRVEFKGAKQTILDVFLKKSRSRGIEPTIDSLEDEEIKRRCAKDWPTLADEIDTPLPDFDHCYQFVREKYRSLPWNS